MKECINMSLNSDMSEKVTYNIPDFPAYIAKLHLSLYPDYRGVSHWHDDLEFIVITGGQMIYDVNGQHITLNSGEGIFVNSRCLHYGFSNTHTDCTFLCVRLSPSLLSGNEYFSDRFVKALTKCQNFPYQKLVPAHLWQRHILDDIHSMYKSCVSSINPFAVLKGFLNITELLLSNMDKHSSDTSDSEDIRSLTAMIGYVQQNYQDRLLLKDIEAAGSCCKTKCTSLFQKYLSVSPMQYLNNYRLEKGCALLRTTGNSITEIAYACGFSGSSYFCEAFRKNYKLTPGAYRKLFRAL